MEQGGISVGPLDSDRDQISEVAALHRRAFPRSELGHLGDEALRRYYRWVLQGPHDVTALVARIDGHLAGFLIGGVFRGSTIGFIKQERWFLIGRTLLHPTIVIRGSGRRALRVAGRLLTRRAEPAASEDPSRVPEGSFGVLAVAVDPDLRRGGVGTALIAAAEEAAIDLGFTATHLTLDPSNTPAVTFYASIGWVPLGVPGDDPWRCLIGTQLVARRPPAGASPD